MAGGGLIYAVIVGMWALVLIPMWLRRHDEAQETKSADRFARAMGTLRRSDPGSLGSASAREVVMPGRPASSRETQVVVTGPRGAATPSGAAAERRRLVLGVLAGVLLVWMTVVLVGRLPVWSLLLPSLLVGGFLVAARRQVALAVEIKRRQERRTTLAAAARAAEARYGAAEGQARRGGRAVDPAPQVTPAHVAPTASIEIRSEVAAPDGSWHAVPTTLPTYVTAPRATRMPRVIDLTTPGSWTGAAMVEQARGTLAAEAVAEGEMRVETFEITVPRDPAVRAGVLVEPSTYADRYVEDDAALGSLAEQDDLDTLLEDPRTGVELPDWRRAANG